jgi:methionyl-tRNA synthetase
MSREKEKFYITTTLPYVNSDPHIGFAAEIIKADVIARYQRLLGKEVIFNTGTDEHGLKIYRNAVEQGKDPQEYCDYYATKFENLKKALNLSYTNFIRTTDAHHVAAAQEFWKRCDENGDIYKKNYKVKYCVGCELEKTESELVDGKCQEHPNLELEHIEEENYFFRWSKYQDKLLELYKNEKFVVPTHRLNEIRNFVESGLQDFSISRLKEKMPWGVPVPGDEDHVMYVWFDALVNYISTLGWPCVCEKEGESPTNPCSRGECTFENFWPGVQVAGKDNLRQQSAMWQAMLMSADIEPSEQILIFGFITSGGQKMSKSLGNTVDPFELVEKYGTDALRYFLLSEITTFEDGDYTQEKFETKYNADLANGLGNLVARTFTLTSKLKEAGLEIPACVKRPETEEELKEWGGMAFEDEVSGAWQEYNQYMKDYNLNKALEVVIEQQRNLDNYISEKKPWIMLKEKDEKTGIVLYNVLDKIRLMSLMLWPFLPETAEKIWSYLGLDYDDIGKLNIEEQMKFGLLEPSTEFNKQEPLFPRIKA